MWEIPYCGFLPTCPHFLRKRHTFLCFISEKIKFIANHDNFQLHEDILWTEAVRKRTRRAPAMFSTPSDQIVNGNLIVKAPHSTIWRKKCIYFCLPMHVNRHLQKRESSIPSFFQTMFTPFSFLFIAIAIEAFLPQPTTRRCNC